MEYSKRNIDQYFRMYPKLQKWINQCPICGAKGYKPDMSEDVMGYPTAADDNIKRMLRPLEVDEYGYCSICSRLQKK